MKVAVAVHGRFHGFDLARGLHERGCLSQVATTYPVFAARRFLPRPIRLRTAPWLEAWRRLHGRVPFVPAPDPGVAEAFGRFAARTLPGDADLLAGWSGATREAIPVAHARGMRVVIERGSTHILHQARVLEAEYGRFGLVAVPVPRAIIERELEEYEDADAVAVPTRFAADTFVAHGIPRGKVHVNPYGIDPARFPARRPSSDGRRVPRILFVGRVGLRKGIPWLLRAFASLGRHAALELVGPVEKGMETVLAGEPTDGVAMAGPLAGEGLARAYAGADIFCLPSIEDGFGLVLLEAMAAGLPVVATDVTGGIELVRPEREGFLVPPGDSRALHDALSALVADADMRRRMGAAARARVEDAFTWRHYRDRAITAYGRILTQGNAAAPARSAP